MEDAVNCQQRVLRRRSCAAGLEGAAPEPEGTQCLRTNAEVAGPCAVPSKPYLTLTGAGARNPRGHLSEIPAADFSFVPVGLTSFLLQAQVAHSDVKNKVAEVASSNA